MTIITNAFASFNAAGNKENFSDEIFLIANEDTPFVQNVARFDIRNRLHQWQTDSLASASTTPALEGNAETASATTATTVLSNNTHIKTRSFGVTNTQEAIDSYGRDSDIEYQTLKVGRELLRDMEAVMLDNNAKVASSSGVAGEAAGLIAWLKDNQDTAGDGTDPAGTGADARAAGTARALDEDMIHNVMSQCYTNGGRPTMLLAKPFQRMQISKFDGNATRESMVAPDGTLRTSVKVFETDFGDLQIMNDIYLPAVGGTDVLALVDPEYAAIGVLRGIEREELAKTGDARVFSMRFEATLEVKSPKAHGVVADLLAS